jgi:hypothetical protein
LPNYGWGVALYNGSPVELDFVLPSIRSHSPGGKLPDPFRDAIPGPRRRVTEPLDDRAAVPSSRGSIVKGTPCALVALEVMPRLPCPWSGWPE